MIFKVMGKANATQYLDERLGSPVLPNEREYTHEVGHGQRERAREMIDRALAALEDVRKRHPDRLNQATGPAFDTEAAEAIHRELKLPVRIAADQDFWRYLACVPFFDLVRWRHAPEDGRPINRDNFGLKRWEALPQRLWFRAELSFDAEAADPYELTRRGTTDFWASGLLRVLYSCSKPLRLALIRYQYPEAGELKGNRYSPQTLTNDDIRIVYKHLRHFQATTEFVLLSDSAAAHLVSSLAPSSRASR